MLKSIVKDTHRLPNTLFCFRRIFLKKIRIRAFLENPQYWTSAKYFHICLFLHQNKEIGKEAYFVRKSAKNTQFFVFLNRSSLCYEIAKMRQQWNSTADKKQMPLFKILFKSQDAPGQWTCQRHSTTLEFKFSHEIIIKITLFLYHLYEIITMVTSPPPAPDISVADGLFLCRDPAFKIEFDYILMGSINIP